MNCSRPDDRANSPLPAITTFSVSTTGTSSTTSFGRRKSSGTDRVRAASEIQTLIATLGLRAMPNRSAWPLHSLERRNRLAVCSAKRSSHVKIASSCCASKPRAKVAVDAIKGALSITSSPRSTTKLISNLYFRFSLQLLATSFNRTAYCVQSPD